MYIPKHFLNTNEEEAMAFMQKYSFGTIVTSGDNRPIASHLPFIIQKNESEILISSHFAKANPQAEAIANREVLIIFSEPHAYISPRHYEKEQNVPTWNYISVHVYGTCSIVEDERLKFELLERTILSYEEGYNQQWNKLPLDFKEKMLKGIVAFNVKVTEIQAKNKLSQNRTSIEQQNIIEKLNSSSHSNENQIAEYMKLNFIK
jgi:transcriptional regulator